MIDLSKTTRFSSHKIVIITRACRADARLADSEDARARKLIETFCVSGVPKSDARELAADHDDDGSPYQPFFAGRLSISKNDVFADLWDREAMRRDRPGALAVAALMSSDDVLIPMSKVCTEAWKSFGQRSHISAAAIKDLIDQGIIKSVRGMIGWKPLVEAEEKFAGILAGNTRDAAHAAYGVALSGRAASNLRDAAASIIDGRTLLMQSATIHRALAMPVDGDERRFSPSKRLAVKALLIDETSMLSSPLITTVCTAIQAEHSGFVGDVKQLSPIGPGSPYDDMSASRCVPVTTLKVNYRTKKAGMLSLCNDVSGTPVA